MLNLHYYFQAPSVKDNNFLLLSEVVDVLASGKAVEVRHIKNDVVAATIKFRKPRLGAKTFGKPAFFVHGMPARNVEQVLDFLSGNAHDVSKVQFFDGTRFHNFIKEPNEFARFASLANSTR